VGSDTITPVFHQLTADYDATKPAAPVYSWDAVNPTTGAANQTIVAKASAKTDTTCAITRPNGSGAGITALENTKTDKSYPCVNFARSSRGPATTDPNTVAFVSLVQDAITWASPAGTAKVKSPVPSSLTVLQLANIYNCTKGFTTWKQVGGSSTAAIVPVLPQSSSGTRSTFLAALGKALGLKNGASLTPGKCVVNGADSKGNPIEENTGVTIGNTDVFGTAAKPAVDTLYPYAISAYIAQTADKHATSIWAPGDLVEHDVTPATKGAKPVAPVSGTGTNEIINPAFLHTTGLSRTIYAVAPNAGTAAKPAIPTGKFSDLAPVLAPATAKVPGFLCKSTKAAADWKSYGFTSLGPSCGAVTDEQLTFG
jgi:hypothetical protein